MNDWELIKDHDFNYIGVNRWNKNDLIAVFSTRHTGVSPKPYNSLNMGLHVADKIDNVIENKKIFLNLFNIESSKTVSCKQVHGNKILIVDEKHLGRGAKDWDDAIADTDGMITNSKNIFLTTFYADCIPVFFFDPVEKVVGVAHCGWRGVMKHIAIDLIKKMNLKFNCKVNNIEIFIGPGIGKCCFEIDYNLAQKTCKEFALFSNIVIEDETNKFYWDLKETLKQDLINNGISEQNIIISNLCTSCRTDLFFSYRREKSHTGRMCAIIGLK